jgi:hypothetical protein
MDTASVDDSSAVFNNALELASWNRPRTSEELRTFIISHDDKLPEDINVE